MTDSENVKPKQKLPDEEKISLINFYKQNKAFQCSEVNFRNKEEKSAVKEDLVSPFDGRFSEDFLDKNFHALRTAFNRELKKYKDKAPKKKWKFFDKLSFLTEELEKPEKKVKFDIKDGKTLIDFFNSNSVLWNHHLTEYRDQSLRDSLLEKLVEKFHGKFNKDNIKRLWHNLQTVCKREKSRQESSKVSDSVSCDVYCSTWEHFSQIEFFDATDEIDASYKSLDRAYTPPVQKKRKPSRTSEDDAKIELWESLAASLKPQDNANAKSESFERANLFWKGCRRFSFAI